MNQTILSSNQRKDPNIWSSLSVVVFLIGIVIVYVVKWRHDEILILKVLTILIINEMLYSMFEIFGLFFINDRTLCSISIIGRMAFSVATNFWIVFITRLVYRMSISPGKCYQKFVQYILKNILLTYLPSIALSAFLLVLIFFSGDMQQNKCWEIVASTDIMDYLIYFVTFVLPNLIASIIILVYLIQLNCDENRKLTIFLIYPISGIIFSVYYMFVKIYQFAFSQSNQNTVIILNLFSQTQPVLYGCFFIFLYFKMKGKNQEIHNSSDLTLEEANGQPSFVA